MSIIDPGRLIAMAASAFGVKPEQVHALMQRAADFITQLDAEKTAFRNSSVRVVGEFKAQLDRIEEQNAAILRALNSDGRGVLNGADNVDARAIQRVAG